MISVAFWAAILALVLPRVASDVLHPERASALWVLAYQRRKPSLRALPRAVRFALSKPARRCLDRLITSRIPAANGNTPTLSQVHTVVGAKMLDLAARNKRNAARLAFMLVLGRPYGVALGGSPECQATLSAPLWVSATDAIFRNGNAAIAATE